MFPPARRALMQGTHPARLAPEPGKIYALLLDVAGEDEDQQAAAKPPPLPTPAATPPP